MVDLFAIGPSEQVARLTHRGVTANAGNLFGCERVRGSLHRSKSLCLVMFKLIWVGIGGFVGASLRYAVSSGVMRVVPPSLFPMGTLTVNVLGCFAIGWLSAYSLSHEIVPDALRLFLFVGILGGFTTFSTFGFETFALAEEGHLAKAAATVFFHLVAGVGAVWLGYALGDAPPS